MKIAIGSIFRNSTSYVDRYFEQIERLESELDAPVALILGEGDSTDSTEKCRRRTEIGPLWRPGFHPPFG